MHGSAGVAEEYRPAIGKCGVDGKKKANEKMNEDVNKFCVHCGDSVNHCNHVHYNTKYICFDCVTIELAAEVARVAADRGEADELEQTH